MESESIVTARQNEAGLDRSAEAHFEAAPNAIHRAPTSLRFPRELGEVSVTSDPVEYQRRRDALRNMYRADSELFQFLKQEVLSSATRVELRPSLNALSDIDFSRAAAMTTQSNQLQQSLVSLPEGLRAPALALTAKQDLPSDVAQSQAAALASALHRLGRAFGDGGWPATIEAVAKRLDYRVVALPERSEPRRVPFVTARGGRINIGELRVPRWDFLGIDRAVVARDFKRRIGNLRSDEPVLFLSGHEFSTHSLLPHHLTARTFDGSGRFADMHVTNFRDLMSRNLDPKRTAFFNLIPESSEAIEKLGLAGGKKRWQQARRRFDKIAGDKGLQRGDGGNREQLLEVLRKGEVDTIVIVGHGKQDAIYLADGSIISVQDILDFGPRESGKKPIVVLISCETGRFDSALRSIAQALLLQGRASAVLAPTRKVPALGATLRLVASLFGGASRAAADAFKEVRDPWQMYVDLSNVSWWFGSFGLDGGAGNSGRGFAGLG
ncbi:MAG TPA: C25 family cysteine peptidase [Thermoanaerobaculia bacterium]|nr:C25 family cysteine peptidase [Thermoanaerobaculia bacterium]